MEQNWLSRFPFMDRRNIVSSEHFLAAKKEVLTGAIFALMPVWFMLLAFILFMSKTSKNFDTIIRPLYTGDMFLISTSCIGSLIYFVAKEYKTSTEEGRREISFHFPHGLSFLVSSILVCIIATMAFVFLKLDLFPEAPQGIWNKVIIIFTSTLVYIFSLWCLFAATVYKNALESPSNTFRDDEDKFLAAWRKR